MKVKRSIAIPAPLNKWIEKEAKKRGDSVSGTVTYFLSIIMDKKDAAHPHS